MNKNYKGSYSVMPSNLEKIDSDWLPKKFCFEAQESKIRIYRDKFSIICEGFTIENPKLESSQLFFVYFYRDSNDKQVLGIMSNGVENEKNILAKELIDFYYNHYTVQSGFIAILPKSKNLKWKILFIKDSCNSQISKISEVSRLTELENNQIQIIDDSKKGKIIKYGGISGIILEKLFLKEIHWVSCPYYSCGKTYFIAINKEKIWIFFEICAQSFKVLEKGFEYCKNISDETNLRPPNYNNSYYQVAVRLYKRLFDDWKINQIFCITFGAGEKKYLDLERGRYLSEKEIKNIYRRISEYETELFSADEFDYFE